MLDTRRTREHTYIMINERMTTMTKMMSKAEEKEMLSTLIANLPAGYVKDILADCKPEIDNAITSDFGFIPFGQRRRESEEHRLAILEAQKKVADLKAEIRDLERTRAILTNGIDQLRSTVRSFARL